MICSARRATNSTIATPDKNGAPALSSSGIQVALLVGFSRFFLLLILACPSLCAGAGRRGGGARGSLGIPRSFRSWELSENSDKKSDELPSFRDHVKPQCAVVKQLEREVTVFRTPSRQLHQGMYIPGVLIPGYPDVESESDQGIIAVQKFCVQRHIETFPYPES
eukprot:2565513-Rhodomonas_salina.2